MPASTDIGLVSLESPDAVGVTSQRVAQVLEQAGMRIFRVSTSRARHRRWG